MNLHDFWAQHVKNYPLQFGEISMLISFYDFFLSFICYLWTSASDTRLLLLLGLLIYYY